MEAPSSVRCGSAQHHCFDVITPGRRRAGGVAPDAGPGGTLATGDGSGNLALPRRRPAGDGSGFRRIVAALLWSRSCPGHTPDTKPQGSSIGSLGLGRRPGGGLYQLVRGIEDGLPPGPIADHALDDEARTRLDSRDLAATLEDQENFAGAIGQDALEVRVARPGLGPHRVDPARNPDTLTPLHPSDGRGFPDMARECRPFEGRFGRLSVRRSSCRPLVRAIGTGPRRSGQPSCGRLTIRCPLASRTSPPVS